jgi:hypothetical protein
MGSEDVLNLADRALCQAKRSGKDQAIGMTPSAVHANPMLTLRAELNTASIAASQ